MALEGTVRGDINKDECLHTDQIFQSVDHHECDSQDEASLELDHVVRENRMYDFHIIYSSSYRVPVMWFRGKALGEYNCLNPLETFAWRAQYVFEHHII